MPRRLAALVCSLIVVAAVEGLTAAPPAPSRLPPPRQLPLVFEQNLGQADPTVSFTARGRGFSLSLTEADAILSFGSTSRAGDPATVRMEMIGGRHGLRVTPEQTLQTRVNYLIGSDRAKWRRNVPAYGRVLARGVYPGVDVAYYGHDGRLENDFLIAPGGDPSAIAFRFDGATATRTHDGDLTLPTPAGVLTLRRPVAYQDLADGRHAVPVEYVVADGRVTLALGEYDRHQRLVIDPAFDYATLIGGPGSDSAYQVAVDSLGNAYVAGVTASPAFPPTVPGSILSQSNAYAPATLPSLSHAIPYVAKIDPTGSTMIYLTYIGGTGVDAPTDIAVDSTGSVYVSVMCGSFDFPMVNGYQTTSKDAGGMFRLDPTGANLLYSTGIHGGPSWGAYASSVAVDNDGNAYVTGQASNGTTNPLSNGYLTTPGAFMIDGSGAFLIKVNTNASGASSLVYSTLFHGSPGDPYGITWAVKVAIDSSGNAYIAGKTSESTLPVPNGFQTAYAGQDDAFLAKFSATGSQLLYASYIGGNGTETIYLTSLGAVPPAGRVGGLAVDDSGHAWVAGMTDSFAPGTNPLSNRNLTAVPFPTTPGTIKTQLTGPPGGGIEPNGFVVKIDTNQSGAASEVWGTLIGNSEPVNITGIAVTPADGNVYVTGTETNIGVPDKFPTTAACAVQAHQTDAFDPNDVYLSRLNADATAYVYSTLIGGSGYDWGGSVAVDATGHAYVVGLTDNGGSPFFTPMPLTPGAFQSSPQGGAYDGFLVKINTGACATDLAITKTTPTTLINVGGQVTFTLTVTNNGTSTATNVVVTDPMATGESFVSASPECTLGGSTVQCTYASIAPGASVQSQITVAATADAALNGIGQFTNTASVTADQIDPDPSNNSSAATVNVSLDSADLSLTKSALPTPAAAGQPLVYTLTVTNNGPGTALNVTLSDPLPASVNLVSAVTNVPGGACQPGPTVTCTLGTLAANAQAVVTITVTPTIAGTIHNSATVKTATFDPSLANNTASVDVNVTGADLALVKSAPSTITAGQPLAYTLTITNNGPGTATGVSVQDPLPAGVNFVSAVPSAGTCGAPPTITCALGDLAPGAKATVTITVTSANGGTLHNTATATSQTFDPDLSNNASSADTTVTPSADVAITNVAPATGTTGAQVTYTLQVTNNGPSAATNVKVTDLLGAGTALVGQTGPACAGGPSGPLSCAIGTLASGGSSTITLTVSTSQPGSVVNTASVSATEADPATANNTAIATTTLSSVADMAVASTGPPSVNVGSPINYAISAVNNGPSPAANVTLVDHLPLGVTVTQAIIQGSATPCVVTTAATEQLVTCPLGTYAPGATGAVSIAVTPTVGGTVTATAIVSSSASDPNAVNNTSVVSTTVAASADLSVALVESPNPVGVQQTVHYTMTVTNNGPLAASGVQATLAFAIAPAVFQITVPSGCSYSQPAKKVTCALGTMASGASQALVILDHVLGPGGVNTTANVSSVTPDPNLANNTASNSIFVVPPHPRPILTFLQGLLAQGAVEPHAERALTRLVEEADRAVTDGHDRRAYEILAAEFPRDVRRFMADGSVTNAAGEALLLAAGEALGFEPNIR